MFFGVRQPVSFHYHGKGESEFNLKLMRPIGGQWLKAPFFGSRRMARHLLGEGFNVSRKRVRRLMRKMGLEAVYPRPKTSKPHPGHPVYPSLLKGMSIERPNQVWCADITFIPMRRGFMYLTAVMDWRSRRVLSWRLSNTLEADFCVAALVEAIQRHVIPDIFNTDQRSQFTSPAFTQVLKDHNIKIFMDGKRAWMNNVFIERLWWSIKYECVYLNEFEDGASLKRGPEKLVWFLQLRRTPFSPGIQDSRSGILRGPEKGGINRNGQINLKSAA